MRGACLRALLNDLPLLCLRQSLVTETEKSLGDFSLVKENSSRGTSMPEWMPQIICSLCHTRTVCSGADITQ